MSFNAKITFTGICTFVPNRDGTKVYVLLPNAEKAQGGADSIDGTAWRRHRGFLRFNVKDLAHAHSISGIDEGISGVQYFQRTPAEGGGEGETGTELFLHASGVSTPAKEAPAPVNLDTIRLADLTKLSPDYSTIDSDLITKKGMRIPGSIAMRMLIDRGTLGPGTSSTWRFPNTLSKLAPNAQALAAQELAHEVILELNGLTSLKLFATSIPGGSSRSLDFSAAPDQTVEMTIANFCDDNPLQWPVANPTPQPDVDFKWHFSLLSGKHRDNLSSFLAGLELPYPLPTDANGQGVNCYPARAQTTVDF